VYLLNVEEKLISCIRLQKNALVLNTVAKYLHQITYDIFFPGVRLFGQEVYSKIPQVNVAFSHVLK
jgi:hypothetical protein